MVKIQIDLPKKLNTFLEVQKAIHDDKDKRATVIRILEERYDKEKELLIALSKQSEKAVL